MSVAIKFDANQPYQLAAIRAVTDLFDGQELVNQSFTAPGAGQAGSQPLPGMTELVFGNTLSLPLESIRRNLRAIQDEPQITSDGSESPAIAEELREVLSDESPELDFSVEMETGTGKTYVYLRTIAELNRKYGWRKFVIVVPSVAIREGVLASLDSLKQHLRDLHDGLQFDHDVYDSSDLTRVRQFATAVHLQILVINIDSFAKDTNVINRPTDEMNGAAPIDFIRSCRPVVIMDEPQNMETDIRRDALASLSPLFKVRYSATHRDLRHLIYRLTPVDAYDLRLVKRIGVRAITQEHDLDLPYVEVHKVAATPTGVTASATIHKATKTGTRPTKVTLRKDMDLEEESKGRGIYNGWLVEDIIAPTEGRPGYVEFGNHRILREGSSNGEGMDQLHRIQIRQAIEAHFDRERELLAKAKRGLIEPMKPLTLFFVDKVANYAPDDGKFRLWFEEEYQAVLRDGKNSLLKHMPSVERVHDGYFATTTKGLAKNTTSDTADARDAYELIMQDKERLLDVSEPLRFIFSHSALGEGWDNPNVFVICNLQDGKSTMRKRQQVGRGLRLPVMSNGERCRLDEINHLTVIANEAFESFASSLQKEIEDETGIKFDDGRIVDEARRTKLEIKKGALADPLFQELWERISPRTTYKFDFETDALVADAVARIQETPAVEAIKIVVRDGTITMDGKAGLDAAGGVEVAAEEVEGVRRVPDVLGELSIRTPISRATIARIVKDSGRVNDATKNPSAFLDATTSAINAAVNAQLADRIEYTPINGDRWEAEQFAEHVGWAYDRTLVGVKKSVTELVACDSNVEVDFAKAIDARDDVKLFLKLPSWFKVPTPLGGYNPDWAIVLEEDAGTFVYLVRETKGGNDLDSLRFENEKLKIKFGKAHFEAIKVDYAFGRDAEKLLSPEDA